MFNWCGPLFPQKRHHSSDSATSGRDRSYSTDSGDALPSRLKEEPWLQDISAAFLQQYVQYLQSIGFILVQVRPQSPARRCVPEGLERMCLHEGLVDMAPSCGHLDLRPKPDRMIIYGGKMELYLFVFREVYFYFIASSSGAQCQKPTAIK